MVLKCPAGGDERAGSEWNAGGLLGCLHRVPADESRADGALSSRLPSAGAHGVLLPASLRRTAHAHSTLPLGPTQLQVSGSTLYENDTAILLHSDAD